MSVEQAGPATRPRHDPRLRRALVALCVTEIVSWGVLYYAFPVLLGELAADTGWSTSVAAGAFSAGALVSAAVGILLGRVIDARGPRLVMTAGSVLGVLAVLAVAAAPSLPLFYAAWMLAGVAQAATLYPPAFTALTGWFQADRVRALTVLTLMGGFSGAIFAPVTGWLLGVLDWRGTYVVLAVVLGVVTIPLHAMALTPPWPSATRARTAPTLARADREHGGAVLRSRGFVVLTVVITVSGFGMYASTINLVGLLVERGDTTRFAAVVLGLCSAGQVLGRLVYAPLAVRTRPRVRMTAILVVGAVALACLGAVPGPPAVVIALAVLAGAARGLHTLLQASVVSERWGTRAFGRINGVFSAPVSAAVALAPAGGVFIAGLARGYPSAFTLLALVTAGAAVLAALLRDLPRPGVDAEAGLAGQDEPVREGHER